MPSTNDELFQLKPFTIAGQELAPAFRKAGPASDIYGAIVARGTMLDPEIQEELVTDFGVNADWAAVFEGIRVDATASYLFRGLVSEMLEIATRYEAAYPDQWLADCIEFSKRNPPRVPASVPIDSALPRPSPTNAKQAHRHAKRKQKISTRSKRRNRN